jgi:uncharacterized membrane protein
MVVHGHVPYRDFFMEYPPGALLVFVPADIATRAHYDAAFKALMVVCGVATLALVIWVLLRIGVTRARLCGGAMFFALSPLALGPISLNTYDPWPALLTVAALAALLADRGLVAGVLLGLGFAAKVYPLVLLPLAFVWVARRRGVRDAVRTAGAFACTAAAVVVPFVVLARHGLVESFRSQAARGLQIESLGAQLLVAADHGAIYSARVVHHARSAVTYNLVGTLPQIVAAISSVLQVAAVAAVAWLYAKRRDDPRRLAIAFAAAVAGFLAFTRFFSPQYLVWLIPLVVLAGSLLAWLALAVALALDQVWFFHYRSIVELGPRSWAVLVRDVLVVCLFALLLRRDAAKDEHAVLLEHELPLGIPP